MFGSVVFKEQKHFMWANVIHTSLNNKHGILARSRTTANIYAFIEIRHFLLYLLDLELCVHFSNQAVIMYQSIFNDYCTYTMLVYFKWKYTFYSSFPWWRDIWKIIRCLKWINCHYFYFDNWKTTFNRVLLGTEIKHLNTFSPLEDKQKNKSISFQETFCFIALPLTQESHRGYNNRVIEKTFDELRSLTQILESGDTKWKDNCIICSNGSYYNNGDGDLEAWGEREDGPSPVTSARERASSGRSRSVRGSPPRLALWTLHSQPNTTGRHRCDPVGVTLNLCLNLLTGSHSCG